MLTGIHYLRGICALSVVAFHAITLFALQSGAPPAWPHYVLASGVDLFFVISGFLMVRTTQQYAETRLDRWKFLRKRLARIGPMYWLLTAMLATAIVMHPTLSEKPVDAAMILRSVFFLPTDLGSATLQTTIVSAGWTLVYEMFFYLLFTVCTGFHYRRGLAAVIAIIVGLSMLHPLVTGFYPSIYTNSIMIEFAFGIVLALLPEVRSSRLAAAIAVIGVGALAAGTAIGGNTLTFRFLEWGVGAALIVYATSSIRAPGSSPLMMLLGDASYTIYLVHMYFIKGASHFFHSPLLGWVAPALIAVTAGIICHKLVEAPIQRILREAPLRRRAAVLSNAERQ